MRADKGEKLASHLLSDLAPLLALFGEQVTKQFLSESMGWADNIIFAMAPLGIITAIISTIRVGGPSWLKAIVGRSREGRAEVELELMSSNSPDVGEMWNGQTIVRVLGTPPIFQLVYAPEKITIETDPAKYIGTLEGENNFFRPISRRCNSREHIEGEYNHDIELRPLLRSTDHPQQASNGIYPPNISLNARGEPVRGWENWAWALIGILVQLTVLAYEGLITFNTSWGASSVDPEESSIQAFQLTAAGTVALAFGMLICSYVVEGASIETDWVRTGRTKKLKVAWIQKGGVVNDQVFDSYIILGHEGQRVVRTSQRGNDKVGVKLQYWVLLGTFISVAGFIIQFAGLRGMSWRATVVQLAAMILMTIVRSIVRRRMSRVPTAIKVIEGHEIDSMAQTIGGCDSWEVVPEWSQQVVDGDKGFAERVLKIRMHLGGLVQWPTDVQRIALILCTAMEKTMDTVYELDDIQLADDFLEKGEFSWKLVVLTLEAQPSAIKANRQTQNSRGQPAKLGGRKRRGELTFKLTRSRESDGWGPWEISEDTRIKIIAVLSLWLLRFREEESNYQYRDPSQRGLKKNAKGFQVWPSGIEQEYFRSWIGGQGMEIRAGNLANILRQEKLPAYRLVGCKKPESLPMGAQSVVILSDTSMQTLFAQQIFSDFFSAVATPIKAILGSTKIRALASLIPSENTYSDPVDNPQRLFGEDGFEAWEIENSALTQLAETVSETGLGTKQEILMSKSTRTIFKPGNIYNYNFVQAHYRI